LYEHTANDTGKLPIFRAEAACEIIAAHFRPTTGWTAAAISEDLILQKDAGAGGGGAAGIALVDGTVDTVVADSNNEWSNATNGLPGVHSGTPGEYYELSEGDWVYLEQTTNSTGVTMGWVLVEITYRLTG